MQHVRSAMGNFYFTRAAPEGVLLVGQDNRPFLADIRLAFWVEQSIPWKDPLQTAELSGLRVYLDGNDISEAVVKAIIGALNKRASAREEYLLGMTRWIDLLARDAPLVKLDRKVISDQRDLAKKFAAGDWAKLLEKIKTEGFGYRGGLHPIHYLFREVLIAPISLRAALFPSAKDDQYPLNTIKDPRLVISNGPCRFYTKKPAPVKLQYEGNVTINIESVFEDAWEQEMRQRLTDIALEVAGMSDKLLELKTRYEDFEKRATEFKTIADGIEASLKELKELPKM